MTQDQVENILKQADTKAGPPAPVSVSLSAIRRRLNRKRTIAKAAFVAAAAVLVAAVTFFSRTNTTTQIPQPHRKIAELENQIKHLQAKTDAALKLIGEVLEEDRKQRRLGALHAQLQSIPDPREEIRKQVDKTAFNLLYQADRLYYELNQTHSAVQAYKQVITLFPENQLADVARERLADIQESRLQKPNSKGEQKWKLQKA